MLKTAVLHNIFVEIMKDFIFQDSRINRKKWIEKKPAFIWNRIFFNIINILTVTFDQFKASLI